VAEPGLRDQVHCLAPDPVRPAQQFGIGDRSAAFQGDRVFWHEVSVNSGDLVDNMPAAERRRVWLCPRTTPRSTDRHLRL
jgi:hypothetical protein